MLTHAGNIWDNYQVDFTYPDNVHVSFSSTQFGDFGFEVSERVYGADGLAEMPYSGPLRILGKNAWTWVDPEQTKPAEPAKFAANGAFLDNLEIRRSRKGPRLHRKHLQRPVPQPDRRRRRKRARLHARPQGRLQRPETTWDELQKDHEAWELGMDLKQFS